MLVLEVAHRRVADPNQAGNMLERGHRLHLEPDVYPKHKALADKLLRSRAWKQVDSEAPRKPTEPVATPSDGILPHQRQALDRLRSREPGPS